MSLRRHTLASLPLADATRGAIPPSESISVICENRIEIFAQTDREKLRAHFKQRAGNPPYDALPWSSAWMEYVEEMRELERQLVEAGEKL